MSKLSDSNHIGNGIMNGYCISVDKTIETKSCDYNFVSMLIRCFDEKQVNDIVVIIGGCVITQLKCASVIIRHCENGVMPCNMRLLVDSAMNDCGTLRIYVKIPKTYGVPLDKFEDFMNCGKWKVGFSDDFYYPKITIDGI